MLYPEAFPYEKGHLPVGDGHSLYYERYGNPAGRPVVYLHGGPGAGSTFREYQWFNPAHYDILLFDQRGAGKSAPFAETKDNTIAKLVADLETLRLYFGYDRWDVTGGSWGSALAMLYAIGHPRRVNNLLLRGIYCADQHGAHDLVDEGGGASQRCPNQWYRAYRDHIPEDERRREGLVMPYYRRLMSEDKNVAVAAARLFDLWDTSIVTAQPQQALLDEIEADPEAGLPLGRLCFHFIVHEFRDEYKTRILENLRQFGPRVSIIHGRQDHICPVQDAIELHEHCPGSNLHIVDNCGHSMREPALQNAFVAITDRWIREETKVA